MFSEEFYPTPSKIVRQMIEPLIVSVNGGYRRFDPDRFGRCPQILEPSAGKGDILDVITGFRETTINGNTFRHRENSALSSVSDCFAIEMNPDLQHVLHGKGYKVIDSDFLQHKPDYSYDIILMNPPFSNGDQHLLHAWEILEGGAIVCLLNAETIRNPYTRNRDILKNLIEQYGEVEEIGSAFQNAERKTCVEVVIVRLFKKAERDRFEFDFTPVSTEGLNVDDGAIQSGGEVAMNDFLGALLRSYDMTKQAYLDYLKAEQALHLFAKQLINAERRSLANVISEADKAPTVKGKYNAFVTGYKVEAWIEILRKLNIEKYMTSGVQKDFDEWKKQQGGMDLNRQNIHSLMMSIINGRDEIMKRACIDVFDHMTKHYKENRMIPEGWKTNSMWKVNRKVILPNAVEIGWGRRPFHINYGWRNDVIRDIDRVMCHLTGKDYDRIVRIQCVVEDERNHKEGNSEFFKMRWFKKGTLHLEWLDKDLWAKFNQIAVDGKNWIGGNV